MTKELIEEARERATIGADVDPIDAARLLNDLADALEAATRVPVQGEPNDELIECALDYIENGTMRPERRKALQALASRATVPDAATEAKQPDGWRNEDAQAAADQAFARWSKHDERDVWNRNGFRLGAEWQKARETFISYRSIADEARAERDAAVAAIERAREVHRKFAYYELEDSCPDTSEDHREERHHESDEIGEFYCEDMPTGDVVCDLCRDADGERMDWPCPTIQALDGAPEPEWEYGVDMGWGQNPPLINVSETEQDARTRATNHPRRKLVRRKVYVGEWEEVSND